VLLLPSAAPGELLRAATREKPCRALFVPGWLPVIYATGTGGNTHANVSTGFRDLVRVMALDRAIAPNSVNAVGSRPASRQRVSGSGAVLITSPGTAAREQVIIRLGQGEVYGLLCEFRNADSLPRHSAMGMWAVLRVE